MLLLTTPSPVPFLKGNRSLLQDSSGFIFHHPWFESVFLCNTSGFHLLGS